jgi:hypothetical protein
MKGAYMKALLIGIIAVVATSLTFAANQGVSSIEKSAVKAKPAQNALILASEVQGKGKGSTQ